LRAVILAAGEGSRMRPLTYIRPKVMLPIANKPILEHLLIEAAAAGIKEYVFVVGYHDDQVRSYFGSGERWGLKIDYVTQRKPLGTADAIKHVGSMIKGNFLVMNGDIIASSRDIAAMAAGSEETIGIKEMANVNGMGVVAIEGKRVISIIEKADNPPSNLANTGIYLFTQAIFDAIDKTPKSVRGEYEITSSLKIMLEQGQLVDYQQIDEWIDCSYPWDLLVANKCLLDGKKAQNLGTVEENAVIRGDVCIGENTIIRSGCYITGPVVIGDNCDIGPNSYIRPFTSIGGNCRIGAAVEVKNSIIMKNTKIPHHNYIGDSVIGEGCNFGSGTKIANLRLDKKNVSINGIDTGRRKMGAIIGDGVTTGINASINVGSLIGNNSSIGPGAVVNGVLMPDSRIF